MNKIYLHSADKIANIKHKSLVKALVIALFEEECIALDQLSYIFCSDAYLLQINKQFLNHDTLTDVITFPFSEEGEPVYGEVYLSVDRIKENAKTFEVEYQNELLRVMVHGALHLCGYTDKTKPQKAQMREKEDYYLKQFNVSREANS
ncbi:rRNA maturation RNase YbeY [Parafilimonas terrae]|jgi:rRNA maturation RNase YbeY|uniref:Endoribonuclease YbeY n=1 Tax=Parafilimonas terrae TaxID=1465490 RepID=A0A1I5VYL5_9BACT|nr:rRNA maturation RNase YbeY [Parafilimonas terrae]SFQ12503.1 rRNA maturation RNase YbeY [Parafilimonas terrae]